MLIILESKKSVEQVERDFPVVAAKHQFGILSVHNLRKKMNEKGIPFEKDCLVFEICNPQQAKKVLERDMSISTALPCRVSVYREGDKTILATLDPAVLLDMFSMTELKSVARDVGEKIRRIMEDLI